MDQEENKNDAVTLTGTGTGSGNGTRSDHRNTSGSSSSSSAHRSERTSVQGTSSATTSSFPSTETATKQSNVTTPNPHTHTTSSTVPTSSSSSVSSLRLRAAAKEFVPSFSPTSSVSTAKQGVATATNASGTGITQLTKWIETLFTHDQLYADPYLLKLMLQDQAQHQWINILLFTHHPRLIAAYPGINVVNVIQALQLSSHFRMTDDQQYFAQKQSAAPFNHSSQLDSSIYVATKSNALLSIPYLYHLFSSFGSISAIYPASLLLAVSNNVPIGTPDSAVLNNDIFDGFIVFSDDETANSVLSLIREYQGNTQMKDKSKQKQKQRNKNASKDGNANDNANHADKGNSNSNTTISPQIQSALNQLIVQSKSQFLKAVLLPYQQQHQLLQQEKMKQKKAAMNREASNWRTSTEADTTSTQLSEFERLMSSLHVDETMLSSKQKRNIRQGQRGSKDDDTTQASAQAASAASATTKSVADRSKMFTLKKSASSGAATLTNRSSQFALGDDGTRGFAKDARLRSELLIDAARELVKKQQDATTDAKLT